ncbi:UNVERIFIED_CONTAM: hypothetical protein PYX00_011878 [Menopon gallinae]|uniref:NADPH--hemoprotein reductase n=1 Tax=Menopon gallinae TaxID=328185 RepID=A0AAW2H8R5_9NEOP
MFIEGEEAGEILGSAPGQQPGLPPPLLARHPRTSPRSMFNEVRIRFRDFTPRSFVQSTATRLALCTEAVRAFRGEVPYCSVKIKDVARRRCTWRTVHAVTLGTQAAFCPGDSLGLFVPNDAQLVDRLFALCSLSDACVSIVRDGRHGFTYTGTLRDFFLHHVDLHTLPRKSFLYALSKTSPRGQMLEYLCSREGTQDYFGMLGRNSVVDIVETFECRPSAAVLVEHCEIIKPRFFSLTNRLGSDAEILVGAIRNGHVSRFVAGCRAGDAVGCYVKENRLMRMTSSAMLLCICTGTGVAPFLAFARNKADSQALWLVFGCRGVEDDLAADVAAEDGVEISRALSSRGDPAMARRLRGGCSATTGGDRAGKEAAQRAPMLPVEVLSSMLEKMHEYPHKARHYNKILLRSIGTYRRKHRQALRDVLRGAAEASSQSRMHKYETKIAEALDAKIEASRKMLELTSAMVDEMKLLLEASDAAVSTDVPSVHSTPNVVRVGDVSGGSYCECRQPAYGDMICCDSLRCRTKWFHFRCVGLTGVPKGSWHCPECRKDWRLCRVD